jgi:hypothetical protein
MQSFQDLPLVSVISPPMSVVPRDENDQSFCQTCLTSSSIDVRKESPRAFDLIRSLVISSGTAIIIFGRVRFTPWTKLISEAWMLFAIGLASERAE